MKKTCILKGSSNIYHGFLVKISYSCYSNQNCPIQYKVAIQKIELNSQIFEES